MYQKNYQLSRTSLREFAKKFAATMQPGRPVLLSGDLGVGKTALAQEIIRVLCPGVTHVPSPSFPLMLCYDSMAGPVWHLDLYRITSPLELEPLGVDDVLAQALCLVEWPERLARVPQAFVRLTLAWTDREDVRALSVDSSP